MIAFHGRRFEVDEHVCVGCGLCEARAPEHFEVPPGGSSKVLRQPRDAEEEELCIEAAEFCPAGALRHQDVQDP